MTDDPLERALRQEALEILFDLACDDKNLHACPTRQLVLLLADCLDLDEDEEVHVDLHAPWLCRYRRAVEAAIIDFKIGSIEQMLAS